MDMTDGELLAATAAGDSEAFGQFYRRHERQVLGYAIRRCSNASDVADLVAETFLGALGSASRFADDGGEATPWLLGIARRVLARQRRAFLRRARLSHRLASLPLLSLDETDVVAAAIDASRLAPELAAALSKLCGKDQELLHLVSSDGLTPAQAGSILGMNPNTARLRLSRARARLRDLLDIHDQADTSPNHEVIHVQP
jgi:RNA polymerase sigma-70 factor (ECF subfamily)